MFFASLLTLLSKTLSKLHGPQLSGTLTLSTLSSPCHITTLPDATIHISASQESALWYGMGFAMARERLWEMEWMRRIGNGTLAEIIPEAEMSDRIARTLGFHRHTLNTDEINPDEVAFLQHFIDGINDFLHECFDYSKPTENILYAMPKPRDWTVIDCVTLMRLLSFQLSKNPLVKLLNVIVAKALLPEQLEAGPDGTVLNRMQQNGNETPREGVGANGNANMKRASSLPDFLSDFESDEFIDVHGHIDWDRLEVLTQQFASAPLDQCSASFVINGDHTRSGKPILACDVHTVTNAPSLWFRCRVTLTHEEEKHADDFDANGFAFVGLPYLWAGQNEHIAWGITPAQFADNTDLFVEYIDMSDNTRFRFNGKWQYATPIDEKIVVKGQKEPIVEMVRVTSHGPIISGVFRSANMGATSKREISIAHPSLEEWADIPMIGFRHLTKARNMKEFKEAAEYLDVLPLVLTYADRNNNTGWISTADIPARPPQSEKWCMFPVGGGNGENEWLPHNFVNFDTDRAQRFYPPVSSEEAKGEVSTGRSFVVSTHSLPTMKNISIPLETVQSRAWDHHSYAFPDDDDSEEDEATRGMFPFLGYPCKFATRAHSIHQQLLKRMGFDETVPPTPLSPQHQISTQISGNHKWSMSVSETLKSLVTRFDVNKGSMDDLAVQTNSESGENNAAPEPKELLLKDAKKLTVQDVLKIQSKQWICPKRIIRMLKPLLDKIHISQIEFEAFQVMHPVGTGITLAHIDEAKRQMLKWNGSLEPDCSAAILIQVFLHELFDFIFSARMDKVEKSIHDADSLQDDEDEHQHSNSQQQPVQKSRAAKLLLKFGIVDMLSPLSTTGKPELLLELLLKRLPPTDDIILCAMMHTIKSLRQLCHKSKSSDAKVEISKYKLGSVYQVKWRHYIDHSLTHGFEIRPKNQKSIGLYTLDCESCSLNTIQEESSNYLAFKANVSSHLYKMHSASAFRMVADLDDSANSCYLFAPGNSGVMGTEYYDNWVEAFVKQEYKPLYDASNKGKTLKIMPLRRIIQDVGAPANNTAAYDMNDMPRQQSTGEFKEEDPVQKKSPKLRLEVGDDEPTFMA